MKAKPSKLFLVALCSVFSLIALASQARAQLGYFTFVNLVGTPERTFLKLNGQDLNPDGFPAGEYTGGMGVPAGSHQVEFSNGSLKPIQGTVSLRPGVSPILVAYLEEKVDENGEKTRTLKNFIPKHVSTSNFVFSAVSLSSKPEVDVQIMSKAWKLKPKEQVTVHQGGAERIMIKANGQDIGSLNTEEMDPGHFLVFVYDGTNNTLQSTIVPDVLHQAPAELRPR